MIPDLDDLIAVLAAHLANSRAIPRDAAERMVRRLIGRARSEYREIGAPLGDDAGLVL